MISLSLCTTIPATSCARASRSPKRTAQDGDKGFDGQYLIAMGIGLFAPPLGLGLYGACLIGDVPIEMTVRPILGYLGLLFVYMLVIAFIPALTL